ncbi:MAG: hypothetical protein V1709_05455, partial [Planctomycetota bacterium]
KLMNEFELALSRLARVRKTGKHYQATCPCHHDKHQSLSVLEGDGGKAVMYCHAGCEYINIIKALDLHLENENTEPKIVATYDYTDADGKLIYQVVRYQPKAFRQRRPDGLLRIMQNDWIWDLKGITPTLYHLPEVIKAIQDERLIFIVEGEKDVDNLRALGQIATTISGGASSKWPPSLVPIFSGAQVCVIPDNDVAGQKYARYVADMLYGWCESIKLIQLVNFIIKDSKGNEIPPVIKDVSDYLETQTVANLLNIVNKSLNYVPVGTVTRDEFESYRGINQWLWKYIIKLENKKRKRYA